MGSGSLISIVDNRRIDGARVLGDRDSAESPPPGLNGFRWRHSASAAQEPLRLDSLVWERAASLLAQRLLAATLLDPVSVNFP